MRLAYAMLRQMADLSLTEAARAIGVSVDTLRRWDRAGQAADDPRRAQPPAGPGREVERLAPRPSRHRDRRLASRRATASRARITSVEVDGVMALVEIEAGPHRITAAITRDAVEELGLVEGVAGHGDRQGDLGDDRKRRSVRRTRCR